MSQIKDIKLQRTAPICRKIGEFASECILFSIYLIRYKSCRIPMGAVIFTWGRPWVLGCQIKLTVYIDNNTRPAPLHISTI